jgi:hypothetical protein
VNTGKIIGIFLSGMLGFTICSSALAENASIVFEIPTMRTDGSTLPIEEIDSYGLWVDDVFYSSVPAAETTAIIDVATGTRCIKMNTTDTEGRVGPFSPAVCKEVKATPNAPIIITIVFVDN